MQGNTLPLPNLNISCFMKNFECVKLAWNSRLGIRFAGLLGLKLG